MSESLSVYTTILLEFLLEIYIFYALVCFRLPRAGKFWLKLVAGLAAMAAVAFGVSFLYPLIGNTAWGRIVIYTGLFALSTLHVRLCFSEGYKTVLVCCSLAYAAQNLVYKLFLFFWCAGEAFNLFDGWGESFGVYYRLTYYSFFAVIAFAVYVVCVRRLVAKILAGKINYRMLILSLSVLAVTIILCSVEDVYFARLGIGRETQYASPEIYVLRETSNVFSVIACIIVLSLVSQTVIQQDLEREVEYLQYAIRQRERQYEISKDTIDLINIKCHDIKYKLNALLSDRKEIPPEVVSDLSESISIYDSRLETGNRLLNVLFTEKSLYCEQNGIRFSCMADGSLLSFMKDGDLYCLFGNIVDNALEAVKSIEEKERRVISIVIKSKNNMLVVQEENYFNGEMEFCDGLPVTTKEDKMYHGFGMRSIRMIVHKYEGELTTYIADDVFHLNIIFGLRKDN